ncbi:DUF4352 domain-containing protein [Halorussus salinus]|uniref:DUF4352 domain-containing protein n=1 Tax=Halorussus salinus TaxID=1364935 RepID=UPI0010926941|nr:DUF4352 domain-containing protein [Halorussus salinus]
MERRKFLALGGTASLTSLAGCQVFSSAVRTGPPHFEEVELTGPSEAEVGQEFSLTISAKNTGGKKGDFTNTLTVGEGAFSVEENIQIGSIPVTKTKSTEVGPFQIGTAGDYEFRITDHGVSHTVSVTTKAFEEDKALEIENGPTISVSDTTVRQSVAYQTSNGREILTPESDRVFAFLQLSIENTGDSKLYTGPDSFSVKNGERIAQLDPVGVSLDALRIDGQPLSSDTVLPGESKAGWILVEVAPKTLKNGIDVFWNRGGENSEPEAHWTVSSTQLPQFEVAQMEFPSEVEIGAEAEGRITVKNTGSAAGTYFGTLERRTTGETQWEQVGVFSLDLPAGASKSWSTTIEKAQIGATQYRLRPGSVHKSIKFTPASRSLGDGYTTPNGAKITTNIGGFNFSGFSDSYTHGSGWTEETTNASSGKKFAFVKVTVKNTTSELLEFPSSTDITVLANGQQYTAKDEVTLGDLELLSPVDGVQYAATWNYESGETESGWLIYEVPSSVSKDQLTIQYSPNDKITANWTTK